IQKKAYNAPALYASPDCTLSGVPHVRDFLSSIRMPHSGTECGFPESPQRTAPGSDFYSGRNALRCNTPSMPISRQPASWVKTNASVSFVQEKKWNEIYTGACELSSKKGVF
ncbi:MAG: hypothetical protein WCY54_02835, partial [Syntrophales bacterium]